MTFSRQWPHFFAMVLSLALHLGIIVLLNAASKHWPGAPLSSNYDAGLTNISISGSGGSNQNKAPNHSAPKAKPRAAIAKTSVQKPMAHLQMSEEVSADSADAAETSNSSAATEGAAGKESAGTQGGPSGTLSSHQVTTLPKVLKEVKSDFPPEAKKLGLTGKVVLSVTIDAQGNVESARVVKPAGYGFDQSAEKALLKFRFAPATLNGNPVAVEIKYTYVFELR